MKNDDLNALHRDIAALRDPGKELVYKDLFAVGCYLHVQGKKKAGRKAVLTVLMALDPKGKRAYFRKILDSLNGNEVRYGHDILAHVEVVALMDEVKTA